MMGTCGAQRCTPPPPATPPVTRALHLPSRASGAAALPVPEQAAGEGPACCCIYVLPSRMACVKLGYCFGVLVISFSNAPLIEFLDAVPLTSRGLWVYCMIWHGSVLSRKEGVT